MNRILSQKFRFFTFISICLLGYVHGYNLNITYLAPYSTIEEPLSLTTFLEFLIANGLLRFRIPLLFLISGYLFAYYDNRSYADSIKKRFKTLIIPYLLWSAIALLFTFLLQQNSYTANIVKETGIDQFGDNRPYLEIGWGGMLDRLLFAPIAYQLWFILALFLYNLFYPVIKYCVQKAPIIWLAFTLLIWMVSVQIFIFDGQGLFFFSIGIWAQKKGVFLEKRPEWLSTGIFFILFLGLCIIKTFMAFELEPNTGTTFFTLMILHRACIICGMIAIWYGIDPVIKNTVQQKWFLQISNYSFFIFALHVPLLPYLMKFVIMSTEGIWLNRLLSYLLVPLVVMIFCILTGSIVKKYLPKTYLILTGGRGF
ncbi:acyltransferase family protein [Sediminibacterium sp. TEGAF015]|uniref:acyltransferase family protein n=1 Tax=Sediminibacterium sp. TEGAF015 TaxID=575378 RepID=UPI00220773EF|nr:acyltransferase [Sediminibacterium sp. TEGAF015]BDQ12697.1 succinyltransferase [Sediminibacterium sp. TEGAF015]